MKIKEIVEGLSFAKFDDSEDEESLEMFWQVPWEPRQKRPISGGARGLKAMNKEMSKRDKVSNPFSV